MSRSLRRFLWFMAVLLALGISAAGLIAYLTEDRIRELAVEQINEALETQVNVDAIEFSLLRKFPRASIEFRNISVQEKSNRKDPQNLLEASSLFLEFDPLDLLTGSYVIDQVHVEGGLVRISRFSDGTVNYKFFKQSDSTGQFQVSLKKVVLKNTDVVYRDFKSGDAIRSHLDNMALSGEFASTDYELKVNSSGSFEEFRIGKFQMGRSYRFKTALALNVMGKEKRYVFNMARISIGDINLLLDGSLHDVNEGMEMELSFVGEKNKFNSLKEFFPASWTDELKAYEVKGDMDIKGNISGLNSAGQNPSIDLKIKVKKGRLKQRETGLEIENVFLSGQFTNGSRRRPSTSSISLDSVSFKGHYGQTSGKLVISNFNDPKANFSLNSVLDLGRLKSMMSNDSLEVLTGRCELSLNMTTDLDSLSKITANNLRNAKASGHASLENVTFKYTGMPQRLENINGEFQFGANVIELEALTFTLSDNNITLLGKFRNLLPYLFFPGERLIVKGGVASEFLHLDKLIGDEEASNSGIPVLENVDLSLHVEAEALRFRKFDARNVRLDLISIHPELAVRNLGFDAMEGSFEGWMRMKILGSDRFNLLSDLTLQQVNIRLLFEQFENFGQKSILAENLKGKANIALHYESEFNSNLEVIPSSVKARSQIDILNGELIDYSPVMALSKYVDVDELKHIKFSRLSNEIEISNSSVLIPFMEIKSSALELGLSGKHSFDNEIEYHFQLYLNDFLFRKAKRSKKNQSEFGDIEADESGRAKLYIRMIGTVDDYKIKLDRKALREKWKEDIKEERSELKELFRQEFTKEKEKEEVEPMQFEIEWEGSPTKKEEATIEDAKEEKKKDDQKKEKKKSLLDKIGGENQEEYEEYDPEKYD